MKSYGVTIQMKANEQYSPVVYYAVQGGSSIFSLRIKSLSVTTEIKATEQYFPFDTVYYAAVKGSLNFETLWIKFESVIILMKANAQ